MRSERRAGFTIVEMMMALVILAMLMTAVGVAVDASIKNYHDNEALYKTVNTARAALLRITTDVRTSQAVALIGTEAGNDADNTQCSMLTVDGADVRYWFDAGSQTLYLKKVTTDEDFVLCKNVTNVTFNRDEGSEAGTKYVRNVRVSLTVTDADGQMPQTLAVAAVVRRNL